MEKEKNIKSVEEDATFVKTSDGISGQDKCPKCGSTHVSLWDRVIGYLTKIKNWSTGRQIEQKTRVYSKC